MPLRATTRVRGDGVTVADEGHRLVPVHGGLRVDAWGPTRDTCLCEAATALIESMADADDLVTGEPASLVIDGADDPAAVGTLLRELLGIVHVLGQVPVRIVLSRTEDGRLSGTVSLAPVDEVRVSRRMPRALVDDEIVRTPERWEAHATLLV